MVAGRKLSAPVLVGTLIATWMGSGSIIGGAGLGYDRGFSALWFDAGVWVAIIVLYLIAGRVRLFGQYTVPDILETRYNSTARLLGTVTTIIAYTAIVSYQFRAGGMVIHIVTGIPEEHGIYVTAIFVIIYTALAGMISVAYTDVVNGIVMITGIIYCYPVLLGKAGGWQQIVSNLPADRFQPLGTMSLMEALAYSLPTMLLILGESNMYQRFFSARDARTARISVVGWIAGTVFLEIMIVVLAVIGSSMFPDINGEMVILHVARFGLPLFVGCILLAVIVSLIVSTADSFLLVSSTCVMHDVYQRYINPDVSQKRMIWYSRLCAVLLGIAALGQTRFFPSVLAMAIYAYTIYGVGITPTTLAAFFWKRATALGGVSALIAGITVTLTWEILKKPAEIPTVYPALFASLFALIGISLLTPPPEKGKWMPFFQKEEK